MTLMLKKANDYQFVFGKDAVPIDHTIADAAAGHPAIPKSH